MHSHLVIAGIVHHEVYAFVHFLCFYTEIVSTCHDVLESCVPPVVAVQVFDLVDIVLGCVVLWVASRAASASWVIFNQNKLNLQESFAIIINPKTLTIGLPLIPWLRGLIISPIIIKLLDTEIKPSFFFDIELQEQSIFIISRNIN